MKKEKILDTNINGNLINILENMEFLLQSTNKEERQKYTQDIADRLEDLMNASDILLEALQGKDEEYLEEATLVLKAVDKDGRYTVKRLDEKK
jgi:hypothetical protein